LQDVPVLRHSKEQHSLSALTHTCGYSIIIEKRGLKNAKKDEKEIRQKALSIMARILLLGFGVEGMLNTHHIGTPHNEILQYTEFSAFRQL
jgi:hypothetical protein